MARAQSQVLSAADKKAVVSDLKAKLKDARSLEKSLTGSIKTIEKDAAVAVKAANKELAVAAKAVAKLEAELAAITGT